MIDVSDIENAKNQTEIDHLVNMAAEERNCELDGGMSYAENVYFFESESDISDSIYELIDILTAAENRWFEV